MCNFFFRYCIAASNGNLAYLQRYLSSCKDKRIINTFIDKSGNTPLILAILKHRKNYLEVVKHLVEECGVDVNQSKVEISQYLVQPQKRERLGNSPPLYYAITNKLEEASIYLIDHGADINRAVRYSTPLRLAVEVNTTVN
jgi:hypothetical protein